MGKYYAVKKGRTTGIFNNWDQCKEQVNGFKGAIYKSFSTLDDAKHYLNDTTSIQSGLSAYVDGSYNIKTKYYGYGCVLIENGKVIARYYGKGNNPDHQSMRNVAGEIMGAIKAISFAIENGYSQIEVAYDYEGIEKWATGVWKANKLGTQKYVEFIRESRRNVSITFKKIAAHTGDKYNEEADQLAKRAVGIR